MVRPSQAFVSRRQFVVSAGAAGLALVAGSRRLFAQDEGAPAPIRLGTGRHTYEWVPGWAKLPEGMNFGNTHGCITVDSSQRVYVNTDTDNAVMVFDTDGNFLGSWGQELKGGLHGMCAVKEAGGEFLYLTHTGRHEVLKTTLEGEVQWVVGVPEASGVYDDPGRYHPTSVAVTPEGDFYAADGYGLSWVHHYRQSGEYVRSFGGPGSEPGKMRTPHGITYDPRGAEPVLIVADRENNRLQRFNLDGELIDVIAGDLRRPCHVNLHGDDVVVADLAGRCTILDGDNKLVTHLGDNPDPGKRAQNGVPRDQWKDGEFISPHCANFDSDGDLYVMDWLALGRVTKLHRVG